MFNHNMTRFILALVLIICFSAQAQARNFDLTNIPELSDVEFMPEVDFNADTQLIAETPFEDEELSYQVRLPNDWNANTPPPQRSLDSGGLSTKLLGIVASYRSPSNFNLNSFFTLEALELTYGVSARNWFINFILNTGFTLNAMDVYSDKKIEAIYVMVDQDTTYAVRTTAIINGDRIVVARYYVPQQLYQDQRTIQAQSIASFALTNMSEKPVEEALNYAFLDQSFVNYPDSWDISAPYIDTVDRMRASFVNRGGPKKVDGQINLYVTSKLLDTDLAKEIRNFQSELNIEGYSLGGFIESAEMSYHSDMNFGSTEVYFMEPAIKTRQINYELWVSVMEGEDYIYITSLLTPARNEEFYMWARNVNAFKVVTQSVRRFE